MRLKLSDKVLRNFFILPIFSAGCGSMRSHIWATRGSGNFPKLVQSGAQTTARARGAAKAAPPPPPAPPPRTRRRSAGPGRRARSSRLGSGLGRGCTGGGVLRGAGGGRGRRRRRGGPAPRRRRPAHFPSFVTERSAAGGRRWGRRGRRRAGGGPGARCGRPGWGAGAERAGRGRGEVLSAEFRALGRESRGADPPAAPPSSPSRRRRRLGPAFPLAQAPGARDPGATSAPGPEPAFPAALRRPPAPPRASPGGRPGPRGPGPRPAEERDRARLGTRARAVGRPRKERG